MAYIYLCIGILAHDLPALRKSAVKYFPSFWLEIRSPTRRRCWWQFRCPLADAEWPVLLRAGPGCGRAQ
jgi:hypothetical protein